MSPPADAVLARLAALADPSRLAGMARYGIGAGEVWGVTVAEVRRVARDVGRDHELAAALWGTGVHEARILASMVDDPALVGDEQLERWAADFASWDLCDQVCQNLFRYAAAVWTTARRWTDRDEPFVKRAAFSLIAGLAVADGDAPDDRFTLFLDDIARAADDDRPVVRKGASWALRQIGKRDAALHERALEVAEALAGSSGRGARWVGRDARRELRDPKVLARRDALRSRPDDRTIRSPAGRRPR